MPQQKRRKRPAIDRTEPDRSFSGWVRSNTKPSGRAGAKEDHDREEDPRKPPNAREASYNAINGAYRLIDEYLRQGQKMAEELWLPNEPRNGSDGPFNAPTRFMRAMGDMTMAWVEVMQEWTTNAPHPNAGPPGPFTAGKPRPAKPNEAAPARPPASGATLKLSVKSKGHVEASVHLADFTNLEALIPGELRTFDGDVPPIRDVKLTADPSSGTAVLRIVVPEKQPAGTYNGLLVEKDTHRPRGTVTLVVS